MRRTGFGARIRRLREDRGWSIPDLAKLAKVPYKTISRLETGEHESPRMDIAIRLARAFGVSIDYLVGLYEENTEHEEHESQASPAPLASELAP